MSLQYSDEKQVNEDLKVYSIENLRSIIRNMMYENSTLHLKVDLKLEENPHIDDDFVHVLHYNFNIIGNKRVNCGPRETKNISFSYYDLDNPDTKYYDSKGGSYFFDDPLIMNSKSDIYKRCLLKHYSLLSFIYEYRHNLKLSNKSSVKIFDKLQDLEKTLFFKFSKNIKEEIIDNPEKDNFNDYLYILLGKSKNAITYSSYYTKWDYVLSKEVEVKPDIEKTILLPDMSNIN